MSTEGEGHACLACGRARFSCWHCIWSPEHCQESSLSKKPVICSMYHWGWPSHTQKGKNNTKRATSPVIYFCPASQPSSYYGTNKYIQLCELHTESRGGRKQQLKTNQDRRRDREGMKRPLKSQEGG